MIWKSEFYVLGENRLSLCPKVRLLLEEYFVLEVYLIIIIIIILTLSLMYKRDICLMMVVKTNKSDRAKSATENLKQFLNLKPCSLFRGVLKRTMSDAVHPNDERHIYNQEIGVL